MGSRACAAAAAIGLALAAFCASAHAATYYVDFEGGSDAEPGTSPKQAFRHCPGGALAVDRARATRLVPGDTVIFRGGVVHRDTIQVEASGAEGAPIVFDGNTAGTFGEGRAIVDGSELLTGWTRCTSAADCGGNPDWQSIYWTNAPADVNPFSVNLCDGDAMLSIAQDPELKDPFWDDDLSSFQPVRAPNPEVESPVEIVTGEGMAENSSRPYVFILDGSRQTSAVVDPCVGAVLTFRYDEARTVQRFALEAYPNYAMPREFVLRADGRQVLSAELKNERGMQEFALVEEVKFTELAFEVRSKWPGDRSYGAVVELQGLDAEGRNVLKAVPVMRYTDPDYFTQDDPHYWDGAYFVLFARPAAIHKQKVVRFDPDTDTIWFEMLGARQYPDTGKFTMMNALRALDRPGEYAMDETTREDGTKRIYLWPPRGEAGLQDVTFSARNRGFYLSGAGHVTVRGFRIQKQGGTSPSAVYARGPATHVCLLDNEVTALRAGPGRSDAVGMTDVSHSVIDGNRIHHNSHCAGLILRRFDDSVVSNNTLHMNGSTSIDFYECSRSKMLHNTVTDHKGVHANGLTLYLGCRDILVEGNRVSGGAAALTAQDGENITIRYNILDGNGGTVMGLWNGRPLEGLTIVNNLILNGNPESSWQVGIFNGNRGGSGYVIRNNIIDALYGEPTFPDDTVFSHNIYTRIGPWQEGKPLGEGELFEPDLKKIFVKPDNGDYRLRPGSPAIDAGTDVGLDHDLAGTPVPQGGAPDVGAYEYVPPKE